MADAAWAGVLLVWRVAALVLVAVYILCVCVFYMYGCEDLFAPLTDQITGLPSSRAAGHL